MEFYAVSCDAHPKVCTELDIDETPSLVVYEQGSTTKKYVKRDGDMEEYNAEQLAAALKVPPALKGLKVPPSVTARRMGKTFTIVEESGDQPKKEANIDKGSDIDDDEDNQDSEEGKLKKKLESKKKNGDSEDDDADADEGDQPSDNGPTPGSDNEDDDDDDKEKLESEKNGDDDDKDSDESHQASEAGPTPAPDEVENEANADADDSHDNKEETDNDSDTEVGENSDVDAGREDKRNDKAIINDVAAHGDQDDVADENVVTTQSDEIDANDEDTETGANAGSDEEEEEANDSKEDETMTKGDYQSDEESGDEDATEGQGIKVDGSLPSVGWKAGPAGLPQLGGAAVQRRHDAGHNKARNQPNALDRFKDEMKIKRQEYEKKRKGLGKYVRKDNRKDKKGNPKLPQDPHAKTEGMKAFIPGETDYIKRTDAMKKRVEKVHKKLKIPPQITEKTPLTKESLPYTKDVRKQSITKKAISALPLVGRRFRMTAEEELILDVSLSLVVGLETGVKFKPGEGLNGQQRKALQNFLDLLNVSLPPEWGIHRLIDDLRRQFGFIIKSESNFKQVLNDHRRPRATWSSSCVHPSKGTMGFSCGFWKLLHVATVGVAELRGGLNLVDAGLVGPQTRIFSPIAAADAIRDFMEQFFNCGPCKENFVKNYDDCSNNRRCDRLTEESEEASTADWKELSVWMWEVHNEVSVRLMNEQKQRASRLGIRDEIVVIWPNIETCVLCFKDDGTWNEAEIFKHLESTYWPDSELDPRSERLIHYEYDDNSLSVFLWVIMLGILGVVYSAIGKTSPTSFKQRLYEAKRLVTTGPGKKRSY